MKHPIVSSQALFTTSGRELDNMNIRISHMNGLYNINKEYFSYKYIRLKNVIMSGRVFQNLAFIMFI